MPPAARQNNANVTLLAVLADDGDDDNADNSYYRFLVDGRHVKYVTVAPAAIPPEDRTFAPDLIPALPPFPPGTWNEGHVAKGAATGKLVFARTVNSKLAGVKNAWHHVRVDHLELQRTANSRIQQNMHRVTHPTLFGGRVVLSKCAEFPWQMRYYEAETTAYQWIKNAGIGPRFLGHVTEAGRIIGFALEYVDNARAAGPGDLRACQRVLAKLHALGICHGDINRFNFLIRKGRSGIASGIAGAGSDDETAVLIDFECARKACSAQELRAEMDKLASELADKSGRGGK